MKQPLIIQTPHGKLRIWPWAPNQVRVTFTLADEFEPGLGPLVVQEPLDDFAAQVRETSDSWKVRLPELVVTIERSTGRLTYQRPDGRLLTQEPSEGGRVLDAYDVVRYDYEPADGPTFEFGADGFKARTPVGSPRVDRRAWHAVHRFEFQAGEALYGLGSHEEGVLNLRGSIQYLYQQNRKIAIPYLVSTQGWSCLWNSGSTMTFRDDQFASSMAVECVHELDFWITASPRLGDLALALRTLTGAVPLLPRWAFGYVQSKERYKTQDEMLATAQEFRRRGLPLSCLVLDWQSWPEGQWGQKSFDASRFPNPKKLADDLHTLGVKFMISIWPILRAGGADHGQFSKKGLLLGNGANYDSFNAEARDLYWKQANEGLFQHGVDAWWCDCTEPFEADWKGSVQPQPEERRALNVGEFHKYLDPSATNLYSFRHSQGLYDHQRAVTSQKRVVNLTRSSYPGQQRFSTIAWSGDFSATWEEYRRQIPAALNFFATGMPWWTFDIGAFFVDRKPELWFWAGDYPQGVGDPAYRELYLRMFQFGAFLPLFRSHGTDTPREPWHFGQPGEIVYDTLAAFLRLRERLVPWFYSEASDVCLRGATLVRPLVFDYPEDLQTHDLKDQFLVGRGLLVCPVVEPLDRGGRQRRVYLPDGEWYDFWTGTRLIGGRWIVSEAGLDRLPLFVRAGSILLFQEPWEIRVYPGAPAQLDWYEDSGDGYEYETGEFCRTPIQWDEGSGTLTLSNREGPYSTKVIPRSFSISGPKGTVLNTVAMTGARVEVLLEL